jgi:hypothetical protein
MANFNKRQRVSTSIDAGLGLVYRLNTLWRSADVAAVKGDLDEYNDILNRIFVNLLYKTPMEVEYADKERTIVKTVDWSQEDSMIFNKFKEMLKGVKKKERDSIALKHKLEYNAAREEHYEILLRKDSWLRKFMMDRGLYLKEVEFDPTNAMWGG